MFFLFPTIGCIVESGFLILIIEFYIIVFCIIFYFLYKKTKKIKENIKIKKYENFINNVTNKK